MTKILFIVPPHISYDDFCHPADITRQIPKKDGKLYGRLITDMPIGVLSLSAYIKKYHPLEAALVDFNVELNELDGFDYPSFYAYFKDFFAAHPPSFQPDIVAISSLFTPSYYNLLDAAKCCRELFPKALILGGGNIPSTLYREIFAASQDFDALCYGEGERPLLQLVQSADPMACIRQSSSWITPDKAERHEAFEHDFIEDLDEIPFLDYDLCQLEKYGKNPAIDAYGGVKFKDNNFHVMSSRGCPFKCTFCASHKVHGRSMRYNSLERVREDFIRLRDQYGANPLVFQDDHFMGDKKRALAIINMVAELGIPVVFQNGLAIYALDREMLEALARAGVTQLNLSLESGNERVLKHVMRKPLKLSIVPRVIHDCQDLGIYTSVNILVGSPGETKEDIETGRAYLRDLGANWYLVHCSCPLVGSEMFEICEENDYLKGDYIVSHFKKAVIETEDFTADYIQDVAYEINLELNFVFNADFRAGRHETALIGFENAIRAKSDHAIAYHYAGQSYAALGQHDKARDYLTKAEAIFASSPYWQRYREMFQIPVVLPENA